MFILVVVRGRICTINSMRYGRNEICCEVFYLFFNLIFIFLFCFDVNIYRCYVSFYFGLSLEGSVWDDEDIVRLLVLVLRRFCFLIDQIRNCTIFIS